MLLSKNQVLQLKAYCGHIKRIALACSSDKLVIRRLIQGIVFLVSDLIFVPLLLQRPSEQPPSAVAPPPETIPSAEITNAMLGSNVSIYDTPSEEPDEQAQLDLAEQIREHERIEEFQAQHRHASIPYCLETLRSILIEEDMVLNWHQRALDNCVRMWDHIFQKASKEDDPS